MLGLVVRWGNCTRHKESTRPVFLWAKSQRDASEFTIAVLQNASKKSQHFIIEGGLKGLQAKLNLIIITRSLNLILRQAFNNFCNFEHLMSGPEGNS